MPSPIYSSPIDVLETNTARVDSGGDDLSGLVGDISKPFATGQAAINALESGAFSNAILEFGYYTSAQNLTTNLATLTIKGVNAVENSIVQTPFNNISFLAASGTISLITIDLCISGTISAATSGEFDIYAQNSRLNNVSTSSGDLSIYGTNTSSFGTVSCATGKFLYLSSIDLLSFPGSLVINSAGCDVTADNCFIESVINANTLTLRDSRVVGTNSASSTVYSDGVLTPRWGKIGGTLTNQSEIDTSGTLAANSDSKIATQKATKTYVDNVAAGINPAVAVQAATTLASDTSGLTYANGAAGIGATFTGSVNTAITFDGYTFTALGQRALIKNDTQAPSGAFNGVYYVTQIQTAILAPILTRALDYDQSSDINNTGAIPVINGTVNGTTQWVLTSSVTTVGTDALTYAKFAANPATQLQAVRLVQNINLQEVAGTIVSKAGTITGTAGVGSSLFLQRITIAGAMSISEIDVALSIGFPATNQGAGTMSRSFAIYSLGNSTSLASVISLSGTSAWNTGTSTAGGSASLTQFQGGWSSPLVQPMTFASSTLSAGEYVVGQLFDFAQASSTWTLNFYGAQAANTFLGSAATNLTSATLGALSSGGLLAGSAHTASASSALTAFTATPTIASVMSSAGLSSLFAFSASTGSLAVVAFNVAPTNIAIGKVGSTASFSTNTASLISATATAASTVSLLLNAGTASVTFMRSLNLTSYSGFTASGSNDVLSNLGTGAVALMGSSGLLAGSFITASGSLGAVTNVALGALASSTLAQLTLPNFGFIGTGSTTSNFPTVFINGIMSTGAIPTAITLTSAAVTYSGSIAFQQPWFALVGK